MSFMISYASQMGLLASSNAVPGWFKCDPNDPACPLRLAVLFGIEIGCSGLLSHIRHRTHCARIPLPRSLFLIDLFAALHLATSMARRMLSDFGSA